MTAQKAVPLQLDSETVHIWLASRAAVGDDMLPGYAWLLDDVERERWRRFRVRSAADQYLIGRALLRTTLSRYAPVSARAWAFEVNAYGSPYVSEPGSHRDLRFNISHTDGLVACAVTRGGEVGIDVENSTREVDPLALAPTVFARPEVEDVAAAAPEQRRQRFLAYWTLKEAYIKARGMGVSLALDGFWFDLSSDPPRIQFGARCPDRSERWYFYRCAPTPSHALAIAVATPSGGTPQLQLHWTVPSASTEDVALRDRSKDCNTTSRDGSG
jgi:4'-phosphopantetheinyl transferase